MTTTRRRFLKTGTMGLLCAAMPAALAKLVVGSPGSISSLTGTDARDLLSLTKESFMPHLNTIFRVKTGSGSVKMKLTSVTHLKAVSKTPEKIAGRESFSLLFETAKSAPRLTQDTYPIEHHALGEFAMFIVPVGQGNKYCEAIISRL